MKKFRVIGSLYGYVRANDTRKALADTFQTLAEHGPEDDFLGICWNSGRKYKRLREQLGLPNLCTYRIVDLFIESITAEEDVGSPFRLSPEADWEFRKEWCGVFAKALRTGVIEVSPELESTLSYPVSKKYQIN